MVSSPQNTQTLEMLMTRAQAGDRLAYERLLKEITPRLRQLVRRRRSFFSSEDVDDALQDIFVSLHAARSKYDPSMPFIPWLSVIAQNRMTDAARWYFRNKAFEVQVEDVALVANSTPEQPESLEYRDSDALVTAMERLPPMQRTAIELLKLGEMPMKAAVVASGRSAGTLRVSVHRAMASLRRALKDGIDGPLGSASLV
jgi:RNA polymerase sigma-70 factor (ECF subfamily)